MNDLTRTEAILQQIIIQREKAEKDLAEEIEQINRLVS